jgi:hypothetical protein
VSLSLNIDMLTHKANDDLRNLVAHMFSSLLLVLMFAVLFLIPSHDTYRLGLLLLGIGAYWLYDVVSHFLETRPKRRRVWIKGSVVNIFIIPTLWFVTLLIIVVSASWAGLVVYTGLCK